MSLGNYIFAASAGAFVVSNVVLSLADANFARLLPAECNHALDTVFFPQPSQVYPHLECMGELGRSLWLEFYLFDMVLFPLIYATLLYHAMARVWPRPRALRLLPVLSGLMDVCENICSTYMLKTFPVRHHALPLVLTLFTRAKWALFFLAVPIVLIGLLYRTVQWLRTSKPKTA